MDSQEKCNDGHEGQIYLWVWSDCERNISIQKHGGEYMWAFCHIEPHKEYGWTTQGWE
jgi:hypothetical protein